MYSTPLRSPPVLQTSAWAPSLAASSMAQPQTGMAPCAPSRSLSRPRCQAMPARQPPSPARPLCKLTITKTTTHSSTHWASPEALRCRARWLCLGLSAISSATIRVHPTAMAATAVQPQERSSTILRTSPSTTSATSTSPIPGTALCVASTNCQALLRLWLVWIPLLHPTAAPGSITHIRSIRI